MSTATAEASIAIGTTDVPEMKKSSSASSSDDEDCKRETSPPTGENPKKAVATTAQEKEEGESNGNSGSSRPTTTESQCNGSRHGGSTKAPSTTATTIAKTSKSKARVQSQPQLLPMPMVPLRQGLRKKASAAELGSWISLALTLDGRDKITKVCQYVARTLAWWLSGTDGARRWSDLKAGLTTSRKAFRLGRSVIELNKLAAMQLPQTFLWHLRRSLDPDGFYEKDHYGGTHPRPEPPPALFRKASSNIGWGPSATASNELYYSGGRRSLLRSMSDALYRPMISRLVSFAQGEASSTASSTSETPLLAIIGTALKTIGLCGFWAGDNVSFLAQSGLFDDYSSKSAARIAKRKSLAGKASRTANQFYFMGAIGGFVANLRAYLHYRRGQLLQLKRQAENAIAVAAARAGQEENEDGSDSDDNNGSSANRCTAAKDGALQAYENGKGKQFDLFVALLKSCVDVIVFSNNPGVDLWRKHRGYPMHEGFHCLCGLISASTVLYNNFPNK